MLASENEIAGCVEGRVAYSPRLEHDRFNNGAMQANLQSKLCYGVLPHLSGTIIPQVLVNNEYRRETIFYPMVKKYFRPRLMDNGKCGKHVRLMIKCNGEYIVHRPRMENETENKATM